MSKSIVQDMYHAATTCEKSRRGISEHFVLRLGLDSTKVRHL